MRIIFFLSVGLSFSSMLSSQSPPVDFLEKILKDNRDLFKNIKKTKLIAIYKMIEIFKTMNKLNGHIKNKIDKELYLEKIKKI